jgi:hypothetical protein
MECEEEDQDWPAFEHWMRSLPEVPVDELVAQCLVASRAAERNAADWFVLLLLRRELRQREFEL